jgi:phosphoribosylformylglycinamidine cyclo-ligase
MHALAHITGGGIAGNLVRVLPERVMAVVEPSSWPRPALFQFIQQAGKVDEAEMRDVFNLGIGMIGVLPAAAVAAAQAAARAAGVETWVIGDVRAGARDVRFAD